ncbi:MAG: glutaminyl-peptide cyclotransferase [Psychroserpens sp.]|nr:glutaminyl-peptide cyclotransferase [Psychroserpens sp.]
MSSIKSLIIIILAIVLVACRDSEQTKPNLSISTNTNGNVITFGNSILFSLSNPDQLNINSEVYTIDGKEIDSNLLKNISLGVHEVIAKVDVDGVVHEFSTFITIVNNELPKIYGYKIINTYPHDITSYTQGLEFYNDTLYESTGQYGESKLRKLDYKSGTVLKNIDLPNQYFGEGLTILDGKVYQLTWQEKTGFVYDISTLEKISSFYYGKSKEGWGICNDGSQLYKSDGTENIWLLNPETLVEEWKIQVYTNKGKIIGINEMEWINGKIYANRYQKNGVAIINPKNGAVEGVIDFSPLRSQVTQHPGLDVLNGIAFNPKTNTIFVTGKRWDKLFEVEVFEK